MEGEGEVGEPGEEGVPRERVGGGHGEEEVGEEVGVVMMGGGVSVGEEEVGVEVRRGEEGAAS